MSRSKIPVPGGRQMVELVRSGRSPDQLARELEPSAQSIRNWLAQADRDDGRRGDGVTTAEREETYESDEVWCIDSSPAFLGHGEQLEGHQQGLAREPAPLVTP